MQQTTRTPHTPGPWKADTFVGGAILSDKLNDYGNWIVAVCTRDLTEQDKANLHLIAAAPDLLDACQAALSQLTEDREEYLQSDIDQLKAAIDKATK